jgi:hypothetical protein
MTDERMAAGTESAESMPVRNKGGRPPKARGAPNSSDLADARWTVRGVGVNVRAMALKAAADRGMTAGDWLSEAIVEKARGRSDKAKVSADTHVDMVPALIPEQMQGKLQELETLTGEIAERLKALEEKHGEKPLAKRVVDIWAKLRSPPEQT